MPLTREKIIRIEFGSHRPLMSRLKAVGPSDTVPYSRMNGLSYPNMNGTTLIVALDSKTATPRMFFVAVLEIGIRPQISDVIRRTKLKISETPK